MSSEESSPVWEKVDRTASVASQQPKGQVDSQDDQAVEKHARFKVEYVNNPDTSNGSSSPPGSPVREGFDTVGFDTIGYSTHEAIPMTVFYRNEASINAAQQRPTLEELHKGFDELDEQEMEDVVVENNANSPVDEVKLVLPLPHIKFGWIKGVLVPCLLNIWGVILYLRLPWLTGQAGIGFMTLIIILSSVVTVITTMSMSAICTNGEVKGGGAYYLISRSLGPEFGGSIGIIFSLANAIGVALYIVGFSETVQDIMARHGVEMVDKLNDVRIIGLLTVILLLIITLIGLEWVVRTQLFLLLLLILSMLDYVFGTFFGSLETSSTVLKSQGYTGYTQETFKANFGPEFRGENFFTTFSIFFPAATGILAGVNISGDLREPSRAIPKGTMLAIAITTVTYIAMVWIIGGCTIKDASGIIPGAVVAVLSSNNSTILGNSSLSHQGPNMTGISTTSVTMVNGSCQIGSCKYGLLNDYQVMERTSLWGPIVLAGIFAATLSSALASLVGSPKTFQAVCRDGIFTGLEFFGKGSGPNDEPRRAYVLTFIIGSAFIAIGELNVIAPIISNFFLMSYALINYSVFAASLSRSPGWRPAFKYYNMWLSLFGCLVCIAIMFLVTWWAALVTVVLVMALYKYVDYRKPQVNWGSSGQAHTYTKALRLALTLNRIEDHVKNFRPQCLVLSGPPSSRKDLVHLGSQMTKNVGLMVCGNVTRTAKATPEAANLVHHKWLRKNKIRAFYSHINAPTFRLGAQALIQCSGLGKLRPNLLLLGYKEDWRDQALEGVEQYVDIMHDAFDYNCGVAILRLPGGAHFSDQEGDSDSYDSFIEESEEGSIKNVSEAPPLIKVEGEEGNESDEQSHSVEVPLNPTLENHPKKKRRARRKPRRNKNHHGHLSQSKAAGDELQEGAEISHLKTPKTGTIDVWWLFDDGGLTMLLPYLLTRSKEWQRCSLRVVIPASDSKLKSNQVRMASLLKKFRINFSDIVEVKGLTQRPTPASVEQFKKLRHELSDKEILDKKTLRQIRLGELVKEISGEAQLIVLTLPIPRKTVVSPILYMGWLETLSANLPPVLLVRGNQSSVLTFYS